MNTPERWGKTLMQGTENLPLVRQLQATVRRRIVLGIVAGTVLFLLLGGILGGLNRGAEGALIGAVSGSLCGAVLGGLVGVALRPKQTAPLGKIALDIELTHREGRYAPGECVSGYVLLTTEDALTLGGGKIYFLCRGFYASEQVTEGAEEPALNRESRQYLLQEANVAPVGTVRVGAVQRYPFSFNIPSDALPTYHGYLCSIRWTLHALVEVAHVPSLRAQKELRVEAKPPVLSPTLAGHRVSVSAAACELSLTIPRTAYAEGERLRGRVDLIPMEEFTAREVRALLLRIENTPPGLNHTVYVSNWDLETGMFQGERQPGGRGTTYVWLEDEIELSGPLRFKPAESARYELDIEIPAEWQPTLATKDGRVTWKLAVVVASDGLPDVRVVQDIIVHTGVSEVTSILAPSVRPM